MLKLKQLQAQKEASEKSPEAPNGASAPPSAPADGQPQSEGQTFTLKKSNSKELADLRAKKAAQGVLSLRRGGKRAGTGKKQNAAELRAQKGTADSASRVVCVWVVDFRVGSGIIVFFDSFVIFVRNIAKICRAPFCYYDIRNYFPCVENVCGSFTAHGIVVKIWRSLLYLSTLAFLEFV